MTHPHDDDGPQRFVRNWLTFNEARPVHRRLLVRFIALIIGFVAVSALLAMASALYR